MHQILGLWKRRIEERMARVVPHCRYAQPEANVIHTGQTMSVEIYARDVPLVEITWERASDY